MVTATQELVLGHPHLVRDSQSKAIVNRNQTEYQRRYAHKRAIRSRDTIIASLQSDVAVLKAQVADILAGITPTK